MTLKHLSLTTGLLLSVAVTTTPAMACGLLGLLLNPDCKPANELLAQDIATCRAQKLEMNACLAYLQNSRTTRLQVQALNALRMQRAMDNIQVPAYQAPAYQPPAWRPVCANANSIGC